jgi:hypothetical protein
MSKSFVWNITNVATGRILEITSDTYYCSQYVLVDKLLYTEIHR